MRHRVYGKHLGRNSNARAALFKNLVQSLFIHGSLETTETKAKSIKGLVDKIINQAKSKDTQRLLQSFFNNKETREKLIKDVAPSLKDRNSGYTSIVKLGVRRGDNAMLVRMSLLLSEKSENKKPVIASAAKQSSSDKNPIKITPSKTPRNDENKVQK